MSSTPPIAPLPPRPAVMGEYRPDWLEKPSTDDLTAYYPAHAARMGIAGQAKIRCKVMGDGRLNACVIETESPKGEHFGEAALTLSAKFRMIPPDDPAKPTGEVTVPLLFGGPPPAVSRPADARAMMQAGFGAAAVSTMLLVLMIWILSRHHNRAATGSTRS